MAFDQFQEDVEPLFGRKVRVELVVSLLRFLKTAKHLDDSVHECSLRPIPPPREPCGRWGTPSVGPSHGTGKPWDGRVLLVMRQFVNESCERWR